MPKLNRNSITVHGLFKLFQSHPSFYSLQATHEAIRRRSKRGVYGKITTVETGGKINHFLVDLPTVYDRLLRNTMTYDEFVELVNEVVTE